MTPAQAHFILILGPVLLGIGAVLLLAFRSGLKPPLLLEVLFEGVRYYVTQVRRDLVEGGRGGLRPRAADRPKPFREWNFTLWSALVFVAVVGGLFTLENGQAFPGWMAIDYLVLVVAGLVQTVAHNLASSRSEPYAAGAVAIAVVLLGVGVIVSAQPTNPVTSTVTIVSINWSFSKRSGTYYELTADDGSFYQLIPSAFTPPLPGGLDAPFFRGEKATLTLNRGTRQVLALRIRDQDYEGNGLNDRSARQYRGWLVGVTLALLGLVPGVIASQRLLRWRRRRERPALLT